MIGDARSGTFRDSRSRWLHHMWKRDWRVYNTPQACTSNIPPESVDRHVTPAVFRSQYHVDELWDRCQCCGPKLLSRHDTVQVRVGNSDELSRPQKRASCSYRRISLAVRLENRERIFFQLSKLTKNFPVEDESSLPVRCSIARNVS